MKTIDELLLELRSRDVRVWVEGNKLRYKAPKEALTPELLDRVKVNKTEIIAFLQDATTQANSQLPPIAVIDRHDRLALSFAQQRLWFLYQFEPDSSSSNMPVVVKIEGSLDIDLLACSITEVFSRHEVLRTTFPAVDGQPTVSIAPPTPIELPVIDLQHLPQQERDVEAARLATVEACAPFDLENGPILRVKLLRLSDRESLFIWNLHCIICDGASSDIFYQDLTATYAALLAGKSAPLKDLPIQYVDFAHWQRQWLQGEVLDSQLKYWQQKLAHLPSAIKLPTDRVRPINVQTYRGDRAARMLPKALNTALNTLSQEMGSTLFMVLLSAFGLLLHRYSMQEELLINFASAGRSQMETEGLIGFFSNTLLLRTDFSGNPTFRELLTRVRQESLGAYAHQDIPFEKLIEELRPEQNQSRSPLFQIKFALNPPWSEGRGMASVQLPSVTFTSLFGYIYHGKTKYDLTLVMREQDEGLGYVFDYNADLFDASTVNRMLDHFQNLLEGILAHPDRRISDLPLLTQKELQHLLPNWHESQTPLVQGTCIHKAFEAQAEKTPHAIALIYKDERLTYQELNCRANQLANYLQVLGVTPEMPVGTCVEPSPNEIVALLGILKAGAICVPLDPTDSPERLNSILENAQVSILLAVEAIAQTVEIASSVKIFCLDREWDTIQKQPYNSSSRDITVENLAYILYASRSIGQSIGVSIPHQNIVRQAESFEEINFTSSDIVLHGSPPSSEIALFEIWNSLLNGAKLVIPATHSTSPESLGQIFQQHKVTTAWLPTRILHRMVNEQHLDNLQSMRQLLTSGDALSFNVVEKLIQDLPKCCLINGYSIPENTGITCYNKITTTPSTHTTIPIGRASNNAQAYILDNHHQPVPIGIIGNLYIGGKNLARGYFNRSDLTDDKFITHSFNQESVMRLHKTGDLARYLPDGLIELVGSADTLVTVNSLKVETSRIETALSQHPDVQEAVISVLSDSFGHESLVAYVVTNAKKTISAKEFRSFLKQKVDVHMLPSAYVILDKLPLTFCGRVEYQSLPLPDSSDRSTEATFTAAQDTLESQLIKLWENTLGIQPIGITDNFFNLGGHSLLAVKLFAKIDETLGKNLPLSILLKAPTIEKLADIIRQDNNLDAWSPLVEIQKGGNKLPLFCIHGGGFNILVYRDLALNIGADQTVYGLQAQGLNGRGGVWANTLESIAADYIKEIRKVQPHGPYNLSGLSNGGNIALEMAQQLHAEGERVTFLGMFDSYGPEGIELLPAFPRLLSSLGYALQYSIPNLITSPQQSDPKVLLFKLKKITKNLLINPAKSQQEIGNSTNSLISSVLQENRLEQKMNCISHYILKHSPWAFFSPSAQLQNNDDTISNTLKLMEESYSKIHKVYDPQPYSGKITLFRALECPPGYQIDRQLGWGKIAKNGVELYKIPGHHTSLMQSPILAEQVRTCLEKSIEQHCLP